MHVDQKFMSYVFYNSLDNKLKLRIDYQAFVALVFVGRCSQEPLNWIDAILVLQIPHFVGFTAGHWMRDPVLFRSVRPLPQTSATELYTFSMTGRST